MKPRRARPSAPNARAAATRARASHGPAAALIGVVAAALAVFAAVTYRVAFRIPFLADDYLFLERVWDASFVSLWNTRGLIFDYYRPWSRELQYWTVVHLFGPVTWPFHLTAFSLWLGSMALYLALVRRAAGVTAAVIATTGVAALAAWGPLLLWIPGLQELWMLAFALAFLLAVTHERIGIALPFLVLALISKETAVVLPGIALAYDMVIARRPVGAALRRTAPLWIVAVAWALFHPLLGGRLWNAAAPASYAWSQSSALATVWRLLLAPLNLDALPAPAGGWTSTAFRGVASLLPLAFLVFAAGMRRGPFAPEGDEQPDPARVALFGAVWAVIAWVPTLSPGLPWHGYYALLGMLGVWATAGVLLQRRPWVALVLVGALTVLRAGRAAAPSDSMGSEWRLARAGEFVNATRDYFMSRYPKLPPDSRVYLTNVPGSVGLIPSDEGSVVLRVWYRDPTLRAFYLSHYLPRRPGDPAGTDYFLSHDPSSGWVEDHSIAWDGAASYDDWEVYAQSMWQFGRYREALNALTELAEVRPERADHAFGVGLCYLRLEDSTAAARWFQRAASIASAPDSIREPARRFERLLGP